MRYFTDRSGHFARVHTTESFGDEFLKAKAETLHREKGWIKSKTIATEIMFGGDWTPCTEKETK